jgi:crotonobetainyl-CoA:carnitine CoA-transferase CaiB-like acyl-CoA transferase
MSSEQVLRWSARGQLLGRQGNRAEDVDLQGMFRARGSEQWIGISVVGDEQWAALAGLVGASHWLEDPELADRAGRQRRADELEKVVAEFVDEHESAEAVALLLDAGVPAAVRTDTRFVHRHPHLAGRGAYEYADLPFAGTVPLPTLPFRRLDQPTWLTRRPPTLGEHNHELLVGELGLDPAVLADLAVRQVVGTTPAGS